MGRSVVIAPDKFKGTLAAPAVAQAIAEGWRAVFPGDTITLVPQADGGEGTLDAIEAATPRAVRNFVAEITGPDGKIIQGEWLMLPGGAAVVELAQCSGLQHMLRLDPMGATSRGLGNVIAAALKGGATSLVIGLGGSASTDGGAGALEALGLKLLDAAGSPLPPGGAALAHLDRIDATMLTNPPPGGVTLFTDVNAPLLGPRGAAHVFGPQKGATPQQVKALDAALERFALVTGGDALQPGVGAAGGAAFGLTTLWGAKIEQGSRRLAELSGLTDAIKTADVVITGEGTFDAQSLGGKVTGTVIRLAAGVRVGVIAGVLEQRPSTPWSVALETLAGSRQESMTEPERWLRVAGELAAKSL